ncbi:MAG: tetratricopeptide repeat protein [Nitrospirota bacterium]
MTPFQGVVADNGSPEHRAERRRVLFAAVLLLPLIIALYGNSLHGPFQFDDRHTIVENPQLQTAEVDWSWFGSRAATIGVGHYRPITFLTYAWNVRLGGIDPFGFHVLNVLFHWTAVAVLMGVVWLIARRALPAIAAGALFAVTPANSEAVNYLAARSSLLVGLWGAASVGAFILMRLAQSSARPVAAMTAGAAAVVALGLGLGSKEVAVVVPLIWLCYDAGWSRALGWRTWLAPYGIVATLAAAYVVATNAHRAIWNVIAGAPSDALGVWENLWTQLAVFPKHVTVFAWPFDLNVLYHVPTVTVPWRPTAVLGLAVLLAMCATAVRWLRTSSDDRRPAAFCLLWFVAALVPIMGYPFHIRFQEHRDYLAWMGLAGAAGCAAAAFDRLGRSHGLRRAIVTGGLVVTAVLATATWTRNMVWTDALRLWSDTVEKSPGHPVARLNLGVEYAVRGDDARALEAYREAIRLSPEYALPYHNAGLVYVARSDYAAARVMFERAVALAPDASDLLTALASTYEALGEPALAAHTLERAVGALDRGRHRPDARLRVAEAFGHIGRSREAAEQYQAVLAQERGRPSLLSAQAWLGLGFLAERAGRPEQALAAYDEALTIHPDLHDARYNRANVLLARGNLPEAKAAYRDLLARAPSFFQAHFNLGRLYEREGKSDDARLAYGAFLRDAPETPAYASARRYAEAYMGGVPSGASSEGRGS